MALTYRTGSGGKGSALTIEELDNNFRHFTGSHSITGSLIISSSLEDPYALVLTGSMGISGSIIPTEVNSTLGTEDNPWLEVYATNNSFKLVSGSGASRATASISFNDGKIEFDSNAGVVMTGSLTGSFTGSGTGSWNGDLTGSLTGSFTGSGNVTGSFTGSFDGEITGSFTGSVDTQYNSGSCLIGCTSSAIPTGARPEGTFEFVVTGGNHFIYAYIDGGWRSGSLN